MNYLSLYRKYRPKCFADVVGQKYIVTILKNAIKFNKVANAYVFAGIKGTGKTSIAKIFANAINCLHNKDGDVCKTCDVCKSFANSNPIDVVELDAASNNGIDEVRQINDNVQFLPTKLSKKVYIIDEAHMLTIAAWNALLKTIEEPPKHVVFIFATTEFAKIPSTIVSRCQCFQFNRISEQETTQFLLDICEKEKIKHDNQSLSTIAKITNGSLRDSLSVLEQVNIFSNGNITNENIFKILGLTSFDETISFLNYLNENNLSKCITIIKNFYKNGADLNVFCNLIVDLLIDKLIYLRTNDEQCLNKTNVGVLNKLQINNLETLNAYINIWQEAFSQISNPIDKMNVLNFAILKCLQITNKTPNTIKAKNDIKKTPSSNSNKDTSMFVLKERKISKDKDTPKKNINSSKNISKNDVLFASVANKDKQTLEKINDLIKKIKDGDICEKVFSMLQTTYKVFCASKNCIVLAFKDAIDADALNQNAKTKDFLLSCCQYLRQPFYFVGFTVDELTQLKDDIKKQMHKKVSDLSLNKLREILNKDKSIQQIAYEYVYKYLGKEKNTNE